MSERTLPREFLSRLSLSRLSPAAAARSPRLSLALPPPPLFLSSLQICSIHLGGVIALMRNIYFSLYRLLIPFESLLFLLPSFPPSPASCRHVCVCLCLRLCEAASCFTLSSRSLDFLPTSNSNSDDGHHRCSCCRSSSPLPLTCGPCIRTQHLLLTHTLTLTRTHIFTFYRSVITHPHAINHLISLSPFLPSLPHTPLGPRVATR